MGRSRSRRAHRRQKAKAADQFSAFFEALHFGTKKYDNHGNGLFTLVWVESMSGHRLQFRRDNTGQWSVQSDVEILDETFETLSQAYENGRELDTSIRVAHGS